MDFPLFHLDGMGNRMLIGVIAALHVLINHALAVGAIPLITTIEWWGRRTGRQDWDRLAYHLLAVCFIVTTSVGAMTGVGIWFSASLANPAAIGSLIRVFFWAWFTEWIIFFIEVSLILVYFLTWKSMSGDRKRLHISVGVALSIASWLTMAIIVAILGFMMDTGQWIERPSLISGVLNPIYLPQLLFRTPTAMVAAGLFALFLTFFFTPPRSDFRVRAVRLIAIWTLAWTPLLLIGAGWYWSVIPEAMRANVATALATAQFEQWHRTVAWLILAAFVITLVIAIWSVALPKRLPRVALLLPLILAGGLLGMFERVREFIRKPDVIAGYMYANGIRHDDYPLLQSQGLLSHATYVPTRLVTDSSRVELGESIFTLACSRCHTTTGVNGIVARVDRLFPNQQWQHDKIKANLGGLERLPYMPPFPGNDEELGLLTDYILSLENEPRSLPGAQESGVSTPEEETLPLSVSAAR